MTEMEYSKHKERVEKYDAFLKNRNGLIEQKLEIEKGVLSICCVS